MAAYKLTYFPCRARGELIRLIFAQAGVEYENVRLTFFPMGSPQWDAMKKSKCPYVCVFLSKFADNNAATKLVPKRSDAYH